MHSVSRQIQLTGMGLEPTLLRGTDKRRKLVRIPRVTKFTRTQHLEASVISQKQTKTFAEEVIHPTTKHSTCLCLRPCCLWVPCTHLSLRTPVPTLSTTLTRAASTQSCMHSASTQMVREYVLEFYCIVPVRGVTILRPRCFVAAAAMVLEEYAASLLDAEHFKASPYGTVPSSNSAHFADMRQALASPPLAFLGDEAAILMEEFATELLREQYSRVVLPRPTTRKPAVASTGATHAEQNCADAVLCDKVVATAADDNASSFASRLDLSAGNNVSDSNMLSYLLGEVDVPC